MHGRPREYKHKLKDPKAQEVYKKKVGGSRRCSDQVIKARSPDP